MCLLKFMPPFVNEIRVVLSFCHQYSSRQIKVFSLMSVVIHQTWQMTEAVFTQYYDSDAYCFILQFLSNISFEAKTNKVCKETNDLSMV